MKQALKEKDTQAHSVKEWDYWLQRRNHRKGIQTLLTRQQLLAMKIEPCFTAYEPIFVGYHCFISFRYSLAALCSSPLLACPSYHVFFIAHLLLIGTVPIRFDSLWIYSNIVSPAPMVLAVYESSSSKDSFSCSSLAHFWLWSPFLEALVQFRLGLIGDFLL